MHNPRVSRHIPEKRVSSREGRKTFRWQLQSRVTIKAAPNPLAVRIAGRFSKLAAPFQKAKHTAADKIHQNKKPNIYSYYTIRGLGKERLGKNRKKSNPPPRQVQLTFIFLLGKIKGKIQKNWNMARLDRWKIRNSFGFPGKSNRNVC